MTEELMLERPLVAFDVETTGLDVQNDRIIEISCIKTLPNGARTTFTRRLNPGVPISPEATLVHGMTLADVAHEPAFAAVATQLLDFLQGCDLTGFNIEQFDLPLLTREFARCDVTFPAADPVHIIDSWRIFLRHEPRDLTAAYKLYCGKALVGAHSAEADARAAADILQAQLQRYPSLPRDAAGLHAFCHPTHPDWIDRDGKIVWKENQPVLSFGRHKNRTLQNLAQEEPEYLKWIVGANFSNDVVRIAKAALGGEFPRKAG